MDQSSPFVQPSFLNLNPVRNETRSFQAYCLVVCSVERVSGWELGGRKADGKAGVGSLGDDGG